MVLVEIIIRGILLGSFYGLIGMGLSIVFGVMRLVNLSHGMFLMIGSYFALSFSNLFGIPPTLTLIIIGPILFLIGFIYQKGLLNKLVPRGMNEPLIATFAIALIIENLLTLAYSVDARSLSSQIAGGALSILGLSLSKILLLNFSVAVIIMIVMHFFLTRTHLGRAMRATSDNRETAIMMGVDTSRIYGYSMAIGCVLAGVAGVFLGMTYTFYPFSGTQYLIIGFGAVIIGGLGSIKGTYLGGIVIGLSQVLGSAFFGSDYQMFLCYFIIFVLLIFKPSGFFGREVKI